MIYAVSLDRLFLLRHGQKPDGKRRYLIGYRVAEDDFVAIQVGALKALNIEAPTDKGPAETAGP